MSKGQNFWDKEYSDSKNFSLSAEPAEDLLKFTRWLERSYGRQFLNPTINVLDLGCGNGRNLIYLAKKYGCRGTGYDLSAVAIKQAKEASLQLPLTFMARTIAGGFDLSGNSFDLVLDMMTSHYLSREDREFLRSEIVRILKPGGRLMYKTFLLDEDINARRMIREYPGGEENSYVHPTIGDVEHVSTEEEIIKFFENNFEIEKIEKTGKHILHGKAGKRRSLIAYLQKKY
ncbi:MAG: hypothetical protein A3H57_03100 [Candidatus Taylorbacteria bacterium RIFCSPLOWO2_02_FULL_43_11]|uniref:Methyltransferase domain-containing protein n=1 Tax=Candidatus Taylorbacteria bacterium RIFCSPHIGHO2_02_FULL_43_32b TaxID=1802306 RepID=A0A1G2MP30_9BACT|nr:MAG: hypothetical protein A2743_03195 [Candidatus Taylorbacteria bacterium RIFCSPHIGHO2_01_FULL_43_47]OHA24752.1 MAG: hypothetical protein A3C72_00760 [Candidatus Taylorbacteria bacterium RIFCSPHIGHO2_02_FULL_43_32b]OHA31678.1 MAG: hypothetical protein A3B08_00105 [Candidatus Taylorbacteria bacterium RIFCSPLOWO2_01_FULL_43_44]OHA35391.1 MAG: hypothetical protein A3H57_03100 [Candidatus Taylorbacteria bacterium RIFCSPLOWO2_02_FULL_43_11]